MKIKLSALIMTVVVAMWFAVTPAFATSFTINGVLQGNVSFSGTLNINTTTGAITSWHIALPAVSALPALTLTPVSSVLFPFAGPSVTSCPAGLFSMSTPSVPGWSELDLELVIPQTTLVGFTGAALVPSVQCKGTPVPFVTNSAYVGFPTGGQKVLVQVTSGSISTTTTVPEPSSLFLLATGLLGVVGAARRKLRG